MDQFYPSRSTWSLRSYCLLFGLLFIALTMASIAAEQFEKVFNTLENIKKEIAATKTSIDIATTNEEWDKLGPLVSRMQDLQGRKVSAETALTLLKNPVAVPSSNSDKEKEETEFNCCVCMVNIANAIAIPCGHLCCCLGCFNEVSNSSHKCPICRGTIESIQQVIQSVTRNKFKTASHSLAEGFSGMGITSKDARAALDAEAGNIRDAGRRLFQLATDRTNSARMVGGSASTGETKEQSGLSESDIASALDIRLARGRTKNMIGERLYQLIQSQQPQHAGKITGMLLEAMDNGALLNLLESSDALKAKVNQAVRVLEDHSRN